MGNIKYSSILHALFVQFADISLMKVILQFTLIAPFVVGLMILFKEIALIAEKKGGRTPNRNESATNNRREEDGTRGSRNSTEDNRDRNRRTPPSTAATNHHKRRTRGEGRTRKHRSNTISESGGIMTKGDRL